MHDAQPGVLEHLVGLSRERIAEQAPHEAVQPRLVAAVEVFERRRVAAGVGRHQRVVVGFVGGAHHEGVCLIRS